MAKFQHETTVGTIKYNYFSEKDEPAVPNPIPPPGDNWELVSTGLSDRVNDRQYIYFFWKRIINS